MSAPTSTFAAQANLPRLPVPRLEDTLERFLRSARALLDDKEYAEAEVTARRFFGPEGEAPALHKRLLARADQLSGTSWLVDWWNEHAYLAVRCPVVINVSYFYQFRPTTTPFGADQCAYAAALLSAFEDIREQLVRCVSVVGPARGTLPPGTCSR